MTKLALWAMATKVRPTRPPARSCPSLYLTTVPADVQSWFHSSEVNVMIDSHVICREWLDTIERVQNTHLHRVGHDGVYRDAQGVELQDSTGVTKGFKGLVKGIQGSIARVRGTGGF